MVRYLHFNNREREREWKNQKLNATLFYLLSFFVALVRILFLQKKKSKNFDS